MFPIRRIQYALAASILAATCSAHAGQAERAVVPTIPDSLARAGRSLVRNIGIESGVAPSVDTVLKSTDVIVRGVPSDATSYLSDDKRDIYTDYLLKNPVFLYGSDGRPSKTPGIAPLTTITVLGGTVTVGNLSFTSTNEALPELPIGSECLLLLKRVGTRLYIAGTSYGAFLISDGRLQPLTRKQEFAPQLHGAPAAAASEELVARVRGLHAP